MTKQANVDVTVVVVNAANALGSEAEAGRIGKAIAAGIDEGFEWNDKVSQDAPFSAGPPVEAYGVMDLLRVIKMIRSFGFDPDMIDFGAIKEIIGEVQDLIAAFREIDPEDADSAATFLDALIVVLVSMSEATEWTVDDDISRVVEVIAGPSELRKMLLDFIARKASNRAQAMDGFEQLDLNTTLEQEALSLSGWLGFARLLISIIAALR